MTPLGAARMKDELSGGADRRPQRPVGSERPARATNMVPSMERENWNRRYEGSELLWTARPNQFLVSEVEATAPGRALDVGSGEGRNAVWLAERGWEVTAVEFSDVAVAKAQHLAAARGIKVDWVLADLRTYQPQPHGYDLVIVLYLHLPPEDRRSVHDAAAQGLSIGGTLLVIGHDRINLSQGHGGPQDPDILFTAEDVIDDVAGVSDVSVVRAEKVTRSVPTDAGERTAIDALVQAVRV